MPNKPERSAAERATERVFAAHAPREPATPRGEGWELTPDPARVPLWLRGPAASSWFLSLALHVVTFLVLGYTVRFVPRGLPQAEPERRGGIVMVRESATQTEYFREQASSAAASPAPPAQETETAAAALPAASEAPVDIAGLLPQASGAEGLGTAISLPGAGQFASGAPSGVGNAGAALAGAGDITTGVFGTKGKGSKFVYVFDRSGSMEGYRGRPLAAAKRELLASLGYLGSTHQFQIIFYNETPTVFNPNPAVAPKLFFADARGQQEATAFVKQIQAAGGTRHYEALMMAFNLSPDVVFFLTDGDEPGLSPEQAARLRARNERLGATLNTIEFGYGPARGETNFLRQLATENRGSYAYVDISLLPAP